MCVNANVLTEQSIVKNYLAAFTSKNPQKWGNFYRELDFPYVSSFLRLGLPPLIYFMVNPLMFC